MAQFQPVIAPLTKNNAVIFFSCELAYSNSTGQLTGKSSCGHVAHTQRVFTFHLVACFARCVYTLTPALIYLGGLQVKLLLFILQGTSQSVTVRRLLMLAYFSLIKLFMPDTQHTWPLFARFTCVNFDSAKIHSLNRYTNRYSNCYGECNCDLNCAVKEIQLNEKTEIAS